MKQHKAALLLGSNSENRLERLMTAQTYIDTLAGTITACSSYYRTAAWGKTDQPDFVNMALLLKTPLPPLTLLQTLLNIEQRMGRRRLVKWGPRSIDIDIIFYDHQCIQSNNLRVPHPEMDKRRFVLTPLAELIPHFKHPENGLTVRQLLEQCPDMLGVEKIA